MWRHRTGLLGVKTSPKVLENGLLSIPFGVLQLSKAPLEDKLEHDLSGHASRVPSPVKVLEFGAKNLNHFVTNSPLPLFLVERPCWENPCWKALVPSYPVRWPCSQGVHLPLHLLFWAEQSFQIDGSGIQYLTATRAVLKGRRAKMQHQTELPWARETA